MRYTAEKARKYILDRVEENAETGCWEWQNSTFWTGYARAKWERKDRSAHRLSFESFVGYIPDGLFVCHTCDNTICVNPNHLFLGTHEDNMRDKQLKGRCPAGESNGGAVLSEIQAIEIIEALQKGFGVSELARQYNVSPSAISKIKVGRTWKSLPRPWNQKGTK